MAGYGNVHEKLVQRAENMADNIYETGARFIDLEDKDIETDVWRETTDGALIASFRDEDDQGAIYEVIISRRGPRMSEQGAAHVVAASTEPDMEAHPAPITESFAFDAGIGNTHAPRETD